ncbi:MAG: VanW family protein [Acidimicrobiia bacterium]
MSRTSRITIVTLGALATLLLLALGAFGIDRALHSGKVLHHVYAASTDLSGSDTVAAELKLLSLEDSLASAPAVLKVGDTTQQLEPDAVDFALDRTGMTQLALAAGRDGSIPDQFGWWVGHLFGTTRIPLTGSLDSQELSDVFDYWDESAFTNHAFNGAVEVEDGKAVARYPREGVGIDRGPASQLILDVMLDPTHPTVTLPETDIAPELTDGDVAAAVVEAEKMIESPITLSRTSPDLSVVFTSGQLASAFRSRVIHDSPAHIELSFDPDEVAAILAPESATLGVAPEDASFEIADDGTVQVIPGHPGEIVDPNATAQALLAASRLAVRSGVLPYENDAQPGFTAEDAEALDIKHLVSQFTTYHSCCQNRVTNIHLMADIIDGAIVLPGEEFSINEYVGERDTARGFLPDHTIINGEMVDTIGGGVSQFATTFYNAVFYGGYEDITHKPHSYYFTRYPEGHEATISWPAPNLIFRNDSDAAILIKTSYTDTSLTISFYGDNGGRTIVGEQKGGKTYATVTSEGDGTGRIVTASVSGRFDQTDPSTEYTANPELAPGEEIEDQKGRIGWSVIVTRDIEYPDGHVDTKTWTVRYRPEPRKVQVNPCMIPPEDGSEPIPCPTTTTETTTTTTTTTTPTAP